MHGWGFASTSSSIVTFFVRIVIVAKSKKLLSSGSLAALRATIESYATFLPLEGVVLRPRLTDMLAIRGSGVNLANSNNHLCLYCFACL